MPDNGIINHRFEFANIAGEIKIAQISGYVGRRDRFRLIEGERRLFDEMIKKQGDILQTLAQWGDVNLIGTKAIIKIFAEISLFQQPAKILIGCYNDARVSEFQNIRPQRIVFLPLQKSEAA